MNATINEIALTLRMLSDWHIGAGVGTPPIIDRRVVRDNFHDNVPNNFHDNFHGNKGLPVIPEGTIKGIWRDAAETLIAGTAHHQVWSCWLDWLFGSRISVGSAPDNTGAPPTQGHAHFSAARLPAALVQGLRESPQWAEALFLLRRHTRLDKHGQVVPETLRTIEFVRGELTLEARACLPEAESLTFANQNSESADKAMQAMRALLIGSALNIERIGAHRRRGAGRCAVVVDGVDRDELDRLFDVLEQSPPELPLRPSTYLPLARFSEPCPAQHPHGQHPHAQHPHKDAPPGAAFDIVLELRQPISCAARQLGNLQTGLDYLPGRALAKAVLSALYKLAPHYPWLREFADGNLVIANGYPEISHTPDSKSVRGVPAPFSLYYDKARGAQGGERYNLMWQSAEAIQAESPDNPPQLKALSGGYVSPELSPESPSQPRSGLPLQPHAVRKILVQRNAVEHQSQRPTSAVGGIYSREAIAAGQTYRTVLRLSGGAYTALKNSEKAQNRSEYAQKSLQKAVQKAFTSTRIGGGAPGCGEVHARAVLPRTYPEPPSCGDGKWLLVYCAADVLLDAQAVALQPLETVLLEAINQVLEAKADVRQSGDLIDVALRTRLDGGWNPRWGLPREAAIVLAAGSCLVLERARPFEARELSALQRRGLGKRRGEGYGELICNPPFLMAGNSGVDYA